MERDHTGCNAISVNDSEQSFFLPVSRGFPPRALLQKGMNDDQAA